MTIFNYFSQFMATATYILMCHLILSKHISRKINALLYAYLILVCIFLAPVLGQFGIPVFFIGSDIILLFNKRDPGFKPASFPDQLGVERFDRLYADDSTAPDFRL